MPPELEEPPLELPELEDPPLELPELDDPPLELLLEDDLPDEDPDEELLPEEEPELLDDEMSMPGSLTPALLHALASANATREPPPRITARIR
jgi:hypothetical protein